MVAELINDVYSDSSFYLKTTLSIDENDECIDHSHFQIYFRSFTGHQTNSGETSISPLFSSLVILKLKHSYVEGIKNK